MAKRTDNTVSASELAKLLGIAPNSVSALANQGVLVRAKRGQYLEHASVTAYCASLRSAAAGRGSPITAQRERLVKAQAQKAEDENRIRTGDMLSAAEVGVRLRKEWNIVRATLLGLPTRWGQRQPQLSNDDVSALDREVRNTLLGLGPATTNEDKADDQQAA
jgi:phage terminase Nu1 subunit (DNA packaging protein)